MINRNKNNLKINMVLVYLQTIHLLGKLRINMDGTGDQGYLVLASGSQYPFKSMRL